MIRSCPNCGGRITFDVASNKLNCESCGSFFDVSDFNTDDDYKETEPQVQEAETKDETIECNVYTCNSCGAEVSVTTTEASTFCIYCGNPTVVFSRISRMHKPDIIVPFTVTKEAAMQAVRNQISHGIFIPSAVKNYKIDLMRGIYIPYYVTSVEYDASMILSSVVKSGKSSHTYYYKRTAYTSMPWITTDASTTLSDSSSQRLEPYNIKASKDFDEDYLIGFYSDMSDVKESDAINTAKNRARAIFEEEMLKSISGSSKKIVNRRDYAGVFKKPYTAMLPAWFLTFRYEDKPYTIIVNGQTGKIVGGVPWNKGLFIGSCIVTAAILSIILTILIAAIISGSDVDDDGVKAYFACFIFAIGFMYTGYSYIKKVTKSIDRTTASTLTSFVKKRQEGN